jgi:hypothetical protein
VRIHWELIASRWGPAFSFHLGYTLERFHIYVAHPKRDHERRISGTRGIAPFRSRLGYTLEGLHIYVAHPIVGTVACAGLKLINWSFHP